MKYIVNQQAIVFFSNGKPIRIEKTAPEYPRVMRCFDLPADQQDEAINSILAEKTDKFTREGFEIDPLEVTYQGERLPKALANKVRSIVSEGLPVTLFAKFWEALQSNPSANSVRQLYDFLAYKELPITEDGCFLAYKGVQADGWSCHGNKNTKVLQGKVSDSGKIKNNVGDTIEVLRRDVDDERSNHCSFGLHVGSLAYAESFAPKVLVVKVNPADVVSVPDDCSCQKCRVAKYEVIDSFDSEIFASVTDEDGNPIESEDDKEHQEFLDRIQSYLERKADSGLDEVSVQSIQNSFSPEYPSRIRVLDALNELDYVWHETDNGKYVDIRELVY
jgi:hypothetical protein